MLKPASSVFALLVVLAALSIASVLLPSGARAQLDTPIAVAMGDAATRYSFPIPNSNDLFYIDWASAKEAMTVNVHFIGFGAGADPNANAAAPGSDKVLFLQMTLARASGAPGLPDCNFALRYVYADDSAAMQTVPRDQIRFGVYKNNAYSLFMPGADNADVPTRTVTQGIASLQDLPAAVSVIGLFAGNLSQDIYDSWDTKYTIGGAGQFPFSFSPGPASDNDDLTLEILSQGTTFDFSMKNYGQSCPTAPNCNFLPGTNGAVMYFDLNILNRQAVPTYNAVFRYHWDPTQTSKMMGISDQNSTVYAIFNQGTNQWVAFDQTQSSELDLVTSNAVQTSSALYDLNRITNHIAIMAQFTTPPQQKPSPKPSSGHDSTGKPPKNAAAGFSTVGTVAAAALLVILSIVGHMLSVF